MKTTRSGCFGLECRGPWISDLSLTKTEPLVMCSGAIEPRAERPIFSATAAGIEPIGQKGDFPWSRAFSS